MDDQSDERCGHRFCSYSRLDPSKVRNHRKNDCVFRATASGVDSGDDTASYTAQRSYRTTRGTQSGGNDLPDTLSGGTFQGTIAILPIHSGPRSGLYSLRDRVASNSNVRLHGVTSRVSGGLGSGSDLNLDALTIGNQSRNHDRGVSSPLNSRRREIIGTPRGRGTRIQRRTPTLKSDISQLRPPGSIANKTASKWPCPTCGNEPDFRKWNAMYADLLVKFRKRGSIMNERNDAIQVAKDVEARYRELVRQLRDLVVECASNPLVNQVDHMIAMGYNEIKTLKGLNKIGNVGEERDDRGEE
jgi:hypothetical protein